jgi:hypothetical protein
MEIIVYSISDPALDTDKSDLVSYLKTGDAQHLVWKEGTTPLMFHCHAVTLRQRQSDNARVVAENRAQGTNALESGFSTVHALDVFYRNCFKVSGAVDIPKVDEETVEVMYQSNKSFGDACVGAGYMILSMDRVASKN